MKTALLALLVGTFACGGKSNPGSELDEARGNQPHASAHKDVAGPPAEIKSFHDTLAPRWHAERSPQRIADTCGAIAEFRTKADAIVAAPAPAGADAAAWTNGGKQLADAVLALEATCKANDAAAFEPAFEQVHTSFHHVMEAGGAGHDEHAEAH